MTCNKCSCGSGEPKFAIHDARGIFVTYACVQCEEEKKSHYRSDIFTDSNYWTDEPVDDDYYSEDF